MKNFRQGDVALIGIKEIPEGEKIKVSNTLAYGEVSGHHHTLYGDVEALCLENQTYVKVGSGGAELRHDDTHRINADGAHPTAEHLPIILLPGAYKLHHQREVDLFSRGKATRIVID